MRKKLFFIMLFLLIIYSVFSENYQKDILELDIDTTVNMALKNNLGIERNRISLEKYKWAIATSWNVFTPDLSLKFLMARTNEEKTGLAELTNPVTGSTVIPGAYDYVMPYDIPQWTAGMQLNLAFSLNAAQVFSVYQTIIDWKNSKISLEMAEKKINRDIRKAYYSLIVLNENITLMEEKIENAKKRYEQAVINRESGTISQIDELAAKASYQNLKPVLLEVKNNYEKALLNFKNMTGIKQEVEIRFISKIPDDSGYKEITKELITSYIDKRLEIQQMKIQIDSLKNARNLAISSLTPTFFMGYLFDPFYIKDPTDSENSDWFSNIDDDWKQPEGMFSFGFSIPLTSLTMFSKEQMNIVNTSFTIKESKKALQELRQNVSVEIQYILLALKKSRESIGALKLNIELSEKVYSLTEDAYNLGLKQLLEVQESEKELNNAKLNLLKEQYEFNASMLDLEYCLNMNIGELEKDNKETEK